MAGDHAVLKNPDLLKETHIPLNIPERDPQISELLNCLKPARNRKKPIHSWLYGKPGTGKTLTAKYVLGKMEKESWVKGLYVNCWENNSYYSILDKIVRDLRILGAEKLSTSFKLERLKHAIGSVPFIIILDEIDMLKKTDMDSVVYNLCNVGNVGLIFICNTTDTLFSMDERIRSRLNAKFIEFIPYSAEELRNIIKQRAEFALRPDSLGRGVLMKIAKISRGDARTAFQTLKHAAYNAENDFSGKIGAKHVKEAYSSVKDLKKIYLLNKLSSNHRLLYEIVKERKEINSGMLWKEYLEKCRKLKKKPIALRTFSEYMNKLIELDLVQWDRALVRGKVRVFKISI